MVQRDGEGLERRVASSPSPQHLPSEGPVRLSHLVPKTSLDGGDAALARSGSATVSDGFARELMRTCVAPGGRMSSPELRESSARMLRVTGGWWPRNVPIPRAAGEDFFTSRMVREWKVFPYGRNIAAVVSAVMDKDRQGAAQKRQAVVRLHEARPKRQRGLRRLLPPAEASRRRR